jgi:hypothetical protein
MGPSDTVTDSDRDGVGGARRPRDRSALRVPARPPAAEDPAR